MVRPLRLRLQSHGHVPLLAVLFVVAAARVVDACTCVQGSGGSCGSLQHADVIVVGTVTATVRVPDQPDASPGVVDAVLLGDVRAVRGVALDRVFTPRGGDSCGASFTTGRRYFIAASRRASGAMFTTICDVILPADASADVEAYVASFTTSSRRGWITGQVLGPAEYSPATRRVTGARVVLDGPVPRAITVGEDGLFGFSDLPPGRYRLGAAAPRGQRRLSAARATLITVAAGTRFCTFERIRLRSTIP